MINAARSRLRHDESGFTLIELLIVITILGVLAAVVVFSVGGIDDRGSQSACRSDYSTLETAQEAHFARTGTYATTTADLATGTPRFLSQASKLYEFTAVTATGYDFVVKTPAPTGFQGANACQVPPE